MLCNVVAMRSRDARTALLRLPPCLAFKCFVVDIRLACSLSHPGSCGSRRAIGGSSSMRSTASSLLASVLVAAGGAIGGPPVLAAPWTSTIGEPLHNSSTQALELTQHLKAIGAKFYGAWTCPVSYTHLTLPTKRSV